ncbi:MAG: hypothetical protein ACHP7P_13915, partial [Terriglobales bacterium]
MRLVSALICCLGAPLLVGLAPAVALADSPPSVGPIHALFVPEEFATHYSVTASDPAGRPLTYKWSLVPPAVDPGCNHFAAQPDNSAIWKHGDQDGCNHLVQGPQGHLGTVNILVTDGQYDCTASYFGTNTGTGLPATCTALSQGASSPASNAQAASGELPGWLWIVGFAVLAGLGVLGWFLLSRKDPCAELRDRCRELQAEAAAAAQKASATKAAAAAAKKACEDAKKAREMAEQRVKSASEGGGSWMEGSEHPGERLTSHDLQLQSQYEAEIRAQVDGGQMTAAQGQDALSHWNDPQQWDRLRKQERERANADLASAKAAESSACADADRLAAEAAAAALAASAAQKAATEACAAADECEHAREDQAKAAAASTPAAPPTVSPPVTPPTVSPPTTRATVSPPPPPKTKHRDECADSDPPRVEVRCETEVDMFRMGEMSLEIDGAFALGQEDVDKAMAGLTDAMWVIDIGTLAVGAVENAPLAAGTWIAGKAGFPSFDTITSLPTDAALDGLRKLIEKMRDLRQAGYWTLKCNRYHLKARCEVTWSCVEGSWAITARNMIIQQVGGPTPITSEREIVKPPEGVNRAI